MIIKTQKIALITGGTSGVGLSIAKGLLAQNYHTYIIGSNAEKGKLVETNLKQSYSKNVTFIQVDLSNLQEVKQFTNDFVAEHDHLDVLANVAGVILSKRSLNPQGFEKTFTIGYLSTYLISNNLAPLLEKAPHGRICNVSGSSRFVFGTKLDFNDLTFSKKYNGFRAAIASIHAKTVLAEILSEKFKDRGIDVNSFDPGGVRSDLLDNVKLLGPVVKVLQNIVMKKDSETGICVTSAKELVGITGKYFVKKKAISLNFEKAYKSKIVQISNELLAEFL